MVSCSPTKMYLLTRDWKEIKCNVVKKAFKFFEDEVCPVWMQLPVSNYMQVTLSWRWCMQKIKTRHTVWHEDKPSPCSWAGWGSQTHRWTSTCTGARRTYAAGYRRRIRGEQRIYPVRGVPGARGGAADPRPPPRGCPPYWSSSWPAQSPPGGRALWCYHPRQPRAPPARLTSPLLTAYRSSSSFSGTRPRRWRRPAHPQQRRRTPPGCWAWSWGWRRRVLLLRAGGDTKQS